MKKGLTLIKRIHLYLFRQAFVAFLFACMAVTFVMLFTQSFRLLSFVIDNSGSLLIFLQLMGLMIPTFLPLVVPLSLGAAILFIYYKFAVDSEIVVMRAAGISSLRLALPALALSGFIVVFCYVLTLWITPAANRELVALQYQVRNNYSIFLVKPGAFNDLSEGLTFYVRARGQNGELQDLLIHDIRTPDHPITIMADSGQFSMNDGVPQVIVFNGKRQEIDRETGHLSQLDFDRYVLDLRVARNGAESRPPDPREMGMAELLNPPADPAKRRTPLEHLYAEMHQRFATPMLALSYALIGLTVILAGEFNRRGMAKRILIAATAIVIVQASTLSVSSMIARNLWLTPVLYAVVLAPVPLCLAVLNVPARLQRLWGLRKRLSLLTRVVPS